MNIIPVGPASSQDLMLTKVIRQKSDFLVMLKEKGWEVMIANNKFLVVILTIAVFLTALSKIVMRNSILLMERIKNKKKEEENEKTRA